MPTAPFRHLRIAAPARQFAWLLAVLVLTPLIVVAGLAALIGTLALGAGHRVPARDRSHRDIALAPILRFEAREAPDVITRAA